MNLFVTGGTGYLGSTLISRLTEEGEVTKVISLIRSHERGRELKARIKFPEKLEYVYSDLRDHDYDLGNIKAVIHLACEHDPLICENKSGEVMDLNVGGTHRLIEAARKFSVPYFIYISAFGVYGKQESMPITEDFICKPNAAKFLITYANEVLTRSLEGSSTKFAILRLVHMFGTGTLPSRIKGELTNKFAKAACMGKDLTVYGNGNQTVDLVHVRDVCDCIYALLNSPDSSWNETYNIGGGRAISINELADIYVNASIEMGLKPPTIAHVKAEHYIESKGLASVLLAISKVREKVGWIPKISIEEGAREIIKAELTRNAQG